MTLPFHPLANIFPLIEGKEFDELVTSIKASNGPREAIVLFDGLILDGRNRALACEAAEVDPRYEVLPGDADPLAFVIDKNLRRRHLDESQRAYAAAKLANLPHGGNRIEQAANLPLASVTPQVTQEHAAALLNVSERSVRAAKAVQEHGTPELQQAVERGSLPVSSAEKAVKLSPDVQRKVAEAAQSGNANAARTVIKQETREVREADLGQKQSALPTKKYGVILADPEWRFEPWSRLTGMDRAADNHYPTSCTEVIAARDVPSIAADDSVLFLCATAPMLPHALLVMAAWGFDYKSNYVLQKDRAITGYWNRNKHEHLLIGTRGNVPCPAPGTQWESLIPSPVNKHSAKAPEILDMIEQYFPTLPKIELNRRGPARPGWDAWGNQAEPHDPITGELPPSTEGPQRSSEAASGVDDPDELLPKFLRRASAEAATP